MNLEIEAVHEGENEAREWKMPRLDLIKSLVTLLLLRETKSQDQSTLTVVPIVSNLAEVAKQMFEQTPHSRKERWNLA